MGSRAGSAGGRAVGAGTTGAHSALGRGGGWAFVSRLSELGKTARLASVGDRVDFVVTLGSGPQESSGRIERQTRGGERWPRDPRRLSAARRGRSLGVLGAQPTAISADGRVLYGTGTCGGVPTYYRLQLRP